MTKKEQALEAVKKANLAAAFEEGIQPLRSGREGIEAFEGEERRLVQEAYAELVLPALRAYYAEMGKLIVAIEGN